MAAELKLRPGWLTRDVKRASERVRAWKTENDKSNKEAKTEQSQKLEQKEQDKD
jgi:hypothetical protein